MAKELKKIAIVSLNRVLKIFMWDYKLCGFNYDNII